MIHSKGHYLTTVKIKFPEKKREHTCWNRYLSTQHTASANHGRSLSSGYAMIYRWVENMLMKAWGEHTLDWKETESKTCGRCRVDGGGTKAR
jgi:hypothetical protein